ncbi:hypothetical protein CQA58_05175 [Helicobacter brantae]|uniref:Outer membrane beta-barrel protein n=2 Tax=Helicobacter brantae TaxID=375927 RepID=A0A3D8J139_9HELI|nr:hypothetical protein CQA58_05175 [Helicobacter brantae]
MEAFGGEESSDSQWKSYFGVEGGVGAMSFCPAFLVSFNGSIIRFNHSTFDWAYGGSVLGGWQKYTSDKVGMRHTLGFRIFVDPNTQALTKDENKGKTTAEFSLYYALDGMFDFVKNGDNHFGMILGVGTDVISANFGANTGVSWLLELTPRIGFYTLFGRHGVDIIASVPILGMGAMVDVSLNSTVTLGYKYFF